MILTGALRPSINYHPPELAMFPLAFDLTIQTVSTTDFLLGQHAVILLTCVLIQTKNDYELTALISMSWD